MTDQMREAQLLAAVLRSRGRNNSLHDIERAAAALESLTSTAPGEQRPVATIHIDGSFIKTQWHVPMPTRGHIDVYTSPPPAPGWNVQFPLSKAALDAFQVGFQTQLRERHRNRFSDKPMISAEEMGLRAMLETLRREAPASSGVADSTEEDRIDHLRLTAFKSNDAGDRQAYFDATSKWFQNRHYRRMAAPSRPDAGCGVRVKPLEWDKHPDDDEWYSYDYGNYGVCDYIVYQSPVSTTAWCLKVRGHLLEEDYPVPESAKAAAQADYEQRILSAIAKPTDASNASVEAEFPSWTDEDKAYELGRRDGYESAVQDIDLATGGDGEFKGSTISGETVDVPAMKQRVIERFANASAEARLREALARGLIGDRSEPDGYWIDIKFQTQEDMREARSAIKAWRVDAIKKSLAAVGGEAKKSEGGVEGHASMERLAEGNPVRVRASEHVGNADLGVKSMPNETLDAAVSNGAGIKPGPSDLTADVTVADVKSVLMKTCSQVWAYEAEKMARALLDAFTVGRR